MLDSLWTWLVAALSPFNASTLLGYFLKPFQHYFLLKCSARPDNFQCSLSESCSRCIPDINTLKCGDSHPWLIFAGSVLCKHWEWTWNVDTAACKMFMLGKRLVFFALGEPVSWLQPSEWQGCKQGFSFLALAKEPSLNITALVSLHEPFLGFLKIHPHKHLWQADEAMIPAQS